VSDVPAASAEAAKHRFEVDSTVEQGEADEQCFHKQLLLTAATKMRLEVRECRQHSNQVRGNKPRRTHRQRFACPVRNFRWGAAKDDR